MTLEEAEQKAQDAVEMGLIDKSQEEAYAQHLLKVHGDSNIPK